MRRSKKMFSRISSMLHTAVEAFAPEMTLLEQFRYHWKCVTQFFLDTTDERMAVENTTIPEHLEQMIEVLKIEEQEYGYSSAGPSMEFMLQNKILETMQTLGKADCPPGMRRYVLIFFTKLLGKMHQKLLPHVNVHKPINKLIRCCGNVKAGPTETEEVQFLLQVSSKLKQDSYLVNFFLEKPASSESGSSPPLSPGGSMGSDREKPEYSLVDSLLVLTKSEDSRVAIKACEGLLLVTSILEDQAASVIVLYTAFCERMADQLSKLFRSLPQVLDPADINQSTATWGFDHDDQYGNDFLGKRQLTAFLSWLDYVNQLSIEAHPMVSKSLAAAIRERFILTAIDSGLSQASEPCAITVTAILTRCLKLVSSPTLAQEFAVILLGNEMSPEFPENQSPHKLRRLLVHRINHLSDQLAVETLRLFQELLKLPYQPIIDTLIVRNFCSRNYLDFRRIRSKSTLIASSVKSNNSFKNFDNIVYAEEGNPLSPENTGSNSQIDNSVVEDEASQVQNHNEQKTPEETTVKAGQDESTVSDANKADSILEYVEPESTQNMSSVEKNESLINCTTNTSITQSENSEKTPPVMQLENTESIDNNTNQNNSSGVDTPSIYENTKNTSQHQQYDSTALLGPDDISLSDSLEELDLTKGFNKRKVEKAVNGFLLLLPETLRTSDASVTSGYDSYLRDAHKMCDKRNKQTLLYDWFLPSQISDDLPEEKGNGEFYEGAFLNTIFRRLERMLDQPFEINLEVTAILSLLCQFRHPFLHEFLVDTSGIVKDSVFTLHRILLKVCQDIKSRGVRNLQNLAVIRNRLSDTSQQDDVISEMPDQMFLEGIIIFEEFCKELAAIAFVSSTTEFRQEEMNSTF